MSRVYYPQARAILQVVFDGFGAQDSQGRAIPALPKAMTVVKNGYSQADSWEVTFDAGDLPIDPRLIRAGVASLYLFQTPALGDEQRVLSRREPVLRPPPEQRTAADTVALEQGLESTRGRWTWDNRPIVVGLFDRAGLELSSSGRWVTINGQDYTDFLTRKQWPPLPGGTARRVPADGRRVDRIIEEVVRMADPGGQLEVEVRGADRADLPAIGAGQVRGKRGIPVGSDTSYWDVIVKLAKRAGLVAFVDGLSVVLAKPRNLTDRNDPSVKRLAWGRNLESMQLERELSREQAPTIIVQGYDERGRKGQQVEYPRRTGADDEQYEIVPAYGITDKRVLQDMAESLFALRGRGERRVVVTTRDLRDMRESDLLQLTAGDAASIDWDEFNREILSDPAIASEAKVEHLVGRGYNRAIAEVVVEHYDKLVALERPLRVHEVSYSYEADQGVTIEIELRDYIVIDGVRAGPDRRTTAERRAAARAGQGGAG